MKYIEALNYFEGNISKMAKALGVSRVTIYTWRDINRIPFRHQCVIEKITGGALKAKFED